MYIRTPRFAMTTAAYPLESAETIRGCLCLGPLRGAPILQMLEALVVGDVLGRADCTLTRPMSLLKKMNVYTSCIVPMFTDDPRRKSKANVSTQSLSTEIFRGSECPTSPWFCCLTLGFVCLDSNSGVRDCSQGVYVVFNVCVFICVLFICVVCLQPGGVCYETSPKP